MADILINGTLAPNGTAFPIARATQIAGGRREVADLTARDAIPASVRTIGAEAYTVSDGKVWRLVGGILNANWVDVTAGAVTFASVAAALAAADAPIDFNAQTLDNVGGINFNTPITFSSSSTSGFGFAFTAPLLPGPFDAIAQFLTPATNVWAIQIDSTLGLGYTGIQYFGGSGSWALYRPSVDNYRIDVTNASLHNYIDANLSSYPYSYLFETQGSVLTPTQDAFRWLIERTKVGKLWSMLDTTAAELWSIENDGTWDLHTHTLTGLADGVNPSDAATVGQLVGRPLTLGVAGIGETHPIDPTEGIYAYNTTAATAGVQQWSPSISFAGSGFKTSTGTTWTASTFYNAGDQVRPTTPNGRVYECGGPGFSGLTEPVWDTTLGNSTGDVGIGWITRRDISDAPASVLMGLSWQGMTASAPVEPQAALGLWQTYGVEAPQLLVKLSPATYLGGLKIERGSATAGPFQPTVEIVSSIGNSPALQLSTDSNGWCGLTISKGGQQLSTNQGTGELRLEFGNQSAAFWVADSDAYGSPHDPYVFLTQYQETSAWPDKNFMRWRIWDLASAASRFLRLEDYAGASVFEIHPNGRLDFTNAANVQATIGAAGAAAVLPLTPEEYVLIETPGGTRAVPAYLP